MKTRIAVLMLWVVVASYGNWLLWGGGDALAAKPWPATMFLIAFSLQLCVWVLAPLIRLCQYSFPVFLVVSALLAFSMVVFVWAATISMFCY